MNSQPDPDILAKSPLGAELDPTDCRTLTGVMAIRRLADGEVRL